MKRKILLSAAAAITLLLAGCTEEEKTAVQNRVGESVEKNLDSNTAGTQDTDGGNTDGGNTDGGNTGGGNTGGGNTGGGNTDGGNTGGGTTDGGNTDGGNTGDDVIPGEGNGADIPTSRGEIGGWYGRTAVSATASDGKIYSHGSAGIFGELINSDEGVDGNDIPSMGFAAIQIVFPQEDGENFKDFFSNYKGASESGKQSWTFQVKNQARVNLSGAPITITLPEVKRVEYKKVAGKIIYGAEIQDDDKLANLILVDVDNKKSYTPEELKEATLSMSGPDCGLNTRTFKWVVGVVGNDDFRSDLAVPCPVSSKSSVDIGSSKGAISADSFNSVVSIEGNREGGKFGLPPM